MQTTLFTAVILAGFCVSPLCLFAEQEVDSLSDGSSSRVHTQESARRGSPCLEIDSLKEEYRVLTFTGEPAFASFTNGCAVSAEHASFAAGNSGIQNRNKEVFA